MADISISPSDLFTICEFFHLNADEWIEEGQEFDAKTYARLSALISNLHKFFEGETGKILVENKDVPNPFYVWLEEQHKEAAETLSPRAVSRWATLDEVLTKLKEIVD